LTVCRCPTQLWKHLSLQTKHDWLFLPYTKQSFEAIDVSKVVLGNGKQSIVKNGVYVAKYQIVIPEDLKIYE
jgi:hypothetical protein